MARSEGIKGRNWSDFCERLIRRNARDVASEIETLHERFLAPVAVALTPREYYVETRNMPSIVYCHLHTICNVQFVYAYVYRVEKTDGYSPSSEPTCKRSL